STRSNDESCGCRFGSSCSYTGTLGSAAPLAPAAPTSMPGTAGPSVPGETPAGVVAPRLGLGMPSEGEPTPMLGPEPSVVGEPVPGMAAPGVPVLVPVLV